MVFYESSIEIAASAARVWAVLADVAAWPRWLPTVTAVEPQGPLPLAMGARYRISQPRMRPAVWSVVALLPGSHFSWECRSPGVRVAASHALKVVAAERTQVSLTIRFTGPMAGLARLLAGRLTCEYLDREVAALKRHVESG